MKKKSGSRVVRVFSRILNVRSWADWDRIKSFTEYLVNGVKRLFVPQQNTSSESFEKAKAELNLSDAELLVKQNALFRLSVVMVTVATLIFIYMGYQLIYGTFRAAIVSLVLVLIALVLAFRYHFWYFQIKHRKLGCTIEEWYRQGILGEKE